MVIGEKLVGLGRVELPTRGLGIGWIFTNVFVFRACNLVDFVLSWAWSGAELATDLATATGRPVTHAGRVVLSPDPARITSGLSVTQDLTASGW